VVYCKCIAVVIAVIWGVLLIVGCRAESAPTQHYSLPRENDPGIVGEDPGGGESDSGNTDEDQQQDAEDEEIIPPGQGPENKDDPGWLRPEPDPDWEEPAEAPGIYLRGFYSRRHQRLVVVADHEIGSDLTVTLEFPEGVTSDLPAENVIPEGRGALEFNLSIEPEVPDSGVIDLGGQDAKGWRVSTDAAYIRAVYIEQSYYDVETETVTIEVDALPNEGYRVALETPTGIKTGEETPRSEAGCSAVAFALAFDPGAPAGWDTTATVTSDRGVQDVEHVAVSRLPSQFEAERLYAFPLRTVVTTADTARIIIASGPTEAPFQYMNGVALMVNTGAAFVDGSLNVGAPGGALAEMDGIWQAVQPDSFLLPSDYMIQERSINSGQVCIDFNVTPLGGDEVTCGGMLLNCELSFAQPGKYVLGFEQHHDVKRTYYSDGASTEYYWGDISNEYEGVPNTITVR